MKEVAVATHHSGRAPCTFDHVHARAVTEFRMTEAASASARHRRHTAEVLGRLLLARSCHVKPAAVPPPPSKPKIGDGLQARWCWIAASHEPLLRSLVCRAKVIAVLGSARRPGGGGAGVSIDDFVLRWAKTRRNGYEIPSLVGGLQRRKRRKSAARQAHAIARLRSSSASRGYSTNATTTSHNAVFSDQH